MKPRTSFSATAAVPSSKYGSNNTCGGSSINSIFSPIGITSGPVKEGLVSQIASKFQQQVGVASSAETEIEKTSAKRKISEPIKNIHKYNSCANSEKISSSGDHILELQNKDCQSHASSLRKLSTNKSESSAKNSRSDSHQARFHNARAMFEKMGSADDLDSIPASPTTNYPTSCSGSGKSYRALSVGAKPTVSESYFNNKINANTTITSNFNPNPGIRSRSISPFGGSRSSSQSSLKQGNSHALPDTSAIVRSSSGSFTEKTPLTSIHSPPTTSENSSYSNMAFKSAKEVNGDSKSINGAFTKSPKQNKNPDEGKENVHHLDKLNSVPKDISSRYKSEIQGESDNSNFMESKLRKTSDYKSPFVNSYSDDSNGPKTSIGSIGRPNIKELTNKQRNWFSNFERGKTSTSASTSGTVTPENVESARRTSVKQDNIPNLLSGFDKHGTKNDVLSKGHVPDATPTPSSNLNQPGDRRPINVLTSSSSDSIEDYIRSWKGDSTTNSSNAHVGSSTNNVSASGLSSVQLTPQSSGPSSLNSDPKLVDSKAGSKPLNLLTGSKDMSPRSNEKSPRPPVLSPKPNPDVVKRYSFNKNKQPADSNLPSSPSLDDISRSIQAKKEINVTPSEARQSKIQLKDQNIRLPSEKTWNVKKSEIIPHTSSDTPKKVDKSVSGSIVRKLSEEYNSKIRQEDQIVSKSSEPTAAMKNIATAKTENYLKKKDSDGIRNGNYVSSKVTSSNRTSIIDSISNEIHSVKSIPDKSEDTQFKHSIINGHKLDKNQVELKYCSDLSQEEKEFEDIDKEFDRLANETEYNELDIVDENEILGEDAISDKNDHCKTLKADKVYIEPNILPKSNDTAITQKQSSALNISNLNKLPETMPFIDSYGLSSTSAPIQDNIFQNQENRIENSKPNKLDLQLQKIYRPNSVESNSVPQSNRADSSKVNPKKETVSPNILDVDNHSVTASNTESPNVTVSSSIDTVHEKKSDNDQDLSGDEFQDEIHFDPTISSGHLGFDKEGDFRNTPITVGGARDAIITPQMDASYLQSQTSRKINSEIDRKESGSEDQPVVDESLPLIMSPKEEENLLSNNIIERKGVLSDEQAEEVKALLTPDKELPPLPQHIDNEVVNGDKTIIEMEKTKADVSPSNSKVEKNRRADSAIDKLDCLVYSSASEEQIEKQCSVQEKSGKGDSIIQTNKTSVDTIVYERPKQNEETYYDEIANVHYYSDGHYWFEIPGLDSTETANLSPSERLPPGCYKKPGKLRFSTSPMKQFSTFAVDDYDRRNDDVDPVAASGEKSYKHNFL